MRACNSELFGNSESVSKMTTIGWGGSSPRASTFTIASFMLYLSVISELRALTRIKPPNGFWLISLSFPGSCHVANS